MPKPRTRRRALELLASFREGATEAILIAHGLTVPLLADGAVVGRILKVHAAPEASTPAAF
jgi:hypothetical protein